jgi:uncharacterized protein (TIGR03437 family)
MNPHSRSLFTLPTRAWFGFASLVSATLLASLLGSATQVKAQQPAWSATGSLGTGRFGHTETLLANGKVLVVGGRLCQSSSSCTEFSSAELYDPATGTWSPTGNLSVARHAHVAVRLLSGKVLVAGGHNGATTWNSAELYDPDTGTWSPTGNLTAARAFATATLLLNGRVLVAGGGGSSFLSSAELYDPATGAWSPAGTMNVARGFHTATLLADGRVLLASGASLTSGTLTLRLSAELYDPANGSWTPTGSLATARVFHTETRLANGKVLVAGGSNFSSIIYDTAELYDPATGLWSATGKMTAARISHTTTLLANGKVLATAGNNNNPVNFTQKSAELYDPATGSWTATAELNVVRGNHRATLLLNGKVLISGGNGGGSPGMTSAELYDSGVATVASVSAANYRGPELAPESIVAAFGANLATDTQSAPWLPLPTQLAGVSVRVRDSLGAERLASLFFVSPAQINYQIPPGTASGTATVTVMNDGNIIAAGLVEIASVAPGLFAADASGRGVAAAYALRVKANGAQSVEPVARFDPAQNRFVAEPVDLGPESDQVFLVLFGTGIKFRSTPSAVSASIGGVSNEVLFAGEAPGFIGLDQVNVRLSRSLAGRGEIEVVLSVEGKAANPVRVSIR